VGKGFAGYYAGQAVSTYGPGIAAALAPYAGYLTQAIAVDLLAAGTSAFWDDIKRYVRTHDVNIPPIGGGGGF
jgi:hypothetical protein